MKAKSLLAAGLALCLLLSGCKEHIPQETATDPTTVTTAPTETTAPIKTHRVSGCSAESYTMDLTLDTQNNLICGTSTLKVTNNTNKALEKLCIRLYSASITSGVISKATNSATG